MAKGSFAPEFEAAIDKLKVGEVYQDVVKTAFGYHIIKLEKRGLAKSQTGTAQPTYDTRHILISTMIKDPQNPGGREVPVRQYVQGKLARERQEAALKKILKENPVSIAKDFDIPEPPPEVLQRERRPPVPRSRPGTPPPAPRPQ